MFMRAAAWPICLLMCAAIAARAEEPLEEIVVTGEFPGPGMWKVTRPDDAANHTLWIIGDPPPLPKRMKWKSRAVEDVVLRSQEILLDATLNVEPDEKIGLFRGLGLIPAALKARKNPDEGTLQSRVPADLYARWLVQKKRYLGYDSGVENWRPIFAADKLRKATISDLNLRESGMVWEVVEKLAKDHKITTTRPQLKFTFKADDLKATIKEFSRQPLADTECFATTLALTEALSDRDTEGIRAHAWATADLETLDALPPLPNPGLPCAMAVMSSQVAKDLVPADIREQLHATWFAAVKKSLETNQTTFAIVPLAKLTRAGGYLARLRELGYVIEAPK